MFLTKGLKVEILNNSIFGCMGYQRVTGIVYMIREDKTGFSIECDQTGALETVDFDDGIINVLE